MVLMNAPISTAQNYAFDYYGLKDGIPDTHVSSIYQDKSGLMWFGFTQGVRFYDSYSFSNVKIENDAYFHAPINAFCETSSHYYFSTFRTLYEGSGRYFHKIPFKGETPKHQLTRLFSFRDTTYALTSRGLYKLQGQQLKKVITHTELDTLHLFKYFLDSKDNLWVTIKQGQLRIYNLKLGKDVSTQILPNDWLNKPSIGDVAEGLNQSYYIASKKEGVYWLKNKVANPLNLETGASLPPKILSLQFEKSSNTLWMAAYGVGLLKYQNKKLELINEKNGLKYTDIITIFCDTEGDVWLATTTHGIIKFKKNGIINLNKNHNLLGDKVQHLFRDAPNQQLISLTEGHISCIKNASITLVEETKTDPVYSLSEIASGRFLAGYTNGFMRWFENGRFSSPKIKILESDEPIRVIADFKGDLFFSAEYGKIYAFNCSTKKTAVITDTLDSDVTCFEKSSTGDTLLIGTNDGLWFMDKQRQIKPFPLDSLNFENVTIQTIKVHKHFIYVATNCMGLFIYDIKKRKVTHLTTVNYLASNAIFNIEIIDANQLILSSPKYINVVKFNQNQTNVYYYRAENYDLSFELSPACMVQTFNKGEVAVGSDNGLLLFNNLIKDNSISPKISVKGILVNNEEIDPLQFSDYFDKSGLPVRFKLNSDANTLIIKFVGVKYSTNEQLSYAYRLSKDTTTWISLGEGEELFLPSIQTGISYVDLKAKGQGNTWGNPIRLSFDKKPPFWRTRFFGFLVMIICLVLFTYFFRSNQRFKSELINDFESTFINLQTARLMLFFAGVVIPFASFINAIVNNEYDIKLFILSGVGVVLLGTGVLTFTSRFIQKNIYATVVVLYVLIVLSYSSVTYIANVNAFSVISLTLSVTVSTLIIEKIRRYVYFAAFVISVLVILIILRPSPEYNQVLFALAIITALFISLISILVKLNVGQRLLFADTVMNKGNTLVIASNSNAQVIFVNHALSQLVGLPEAEILNEGWWILQKDKQKPVSVKETIVNGTMPKTSLTLANGTNGRSFWIEWQNTRLESGVTVSVGSDVTEKQNYEKRFSHIVENAKDIIYITSINGDFTYVNDIAVQVTGYSKEELLTKNFKDIIKRDYQRKVTTFYALQLKSKEQESYLEFPIVTKANKIVWVGQQVLFLEDKITKVFKGTQAICRDITKRVEAEEKLKIANNDLNVLNQVKELILRYQEDEGVLLEGVLKKLFSNRRQNEYFSLGIFDTPYLIRQYALKTLAEGVLTASYTLTDTASQLLETSSVKLIQAFDEFPDYLKQDADLLKNPSHVLSIPLKTTTQLFGYLNVFSEQVITFTEDYLSVLADVSNYLTINFTQAEQKRIISTKNEEIQSYLLKLEDLNDELHYENALKESVIYAKDIDDVCNRMLTHIMATTVKAFCYSFNILDPDQERVMIYQGFKDNTLKRYEYELSEEMRAMLFALEPQLYFYTAEAATNTQLSWFNQPLEHLTCAILVPIQTISTRYGFLGVYTSSESLYHSEDLRKVESIASIVSSFISQYYSNLAINLKNEQIQRYSKQLEYINNDLEEQNHIKALIISIKERDVLIDRLLILTIKNSRFAKGYSINIINNTNNTLTVYSIRRSNTIAYKEVITLSAEQLMYIDTLNERIAKEQDADYATVYQFTIDTKQPSINSKTMMFKGLRNSTQSIGFIGTYSNEENIYEKIDMKFLIELSNSLQNFLSIDEQNEVIAAKNAEINKNTKRLELLNEARQLLINSTSLSKLYINLIELLYTRIDNIHRVSFLIFEKDYQHGHLYYMDSLSFKVEYKNILTTQLPTIPFFEANMDYDIPDLSGKPELTGDDLHWLSVAMRSVYCVPVFVNGKLFGAINMLSRELNNFEEQKPIIKQLKESVSLIIEQIVYKDIIFQKNKDISDNITYAKRIQDAIMSAPLTLKQSFPKSFLFFVQRDDLGGDFYWFHKANGATILAVGDCTGHGISGSLLTILASNYLQQATKEKGLTDPGLILEYLNVSVRGALNQTDSETEILDGLDISCLLYHAETRFLHFSAAMHTLFIVRKGELIEIKGNRFPIGSFQVDLQNYFTTHLMAMEPGDLVILTTDGYIDQFGLLNGKRFGRIKFRELLLKMATYPEAERKALIQQAHLDWRGDGQQTDDICLLCFEVE